MVNCLTFPIERRCCAVWSVSTRFSPVYQPRSVNAATFCLVGIGGVVRAHCVSPFWNLYSVCRFFFVLFFFFPSTLSLPEMLHTVCVCVCRLVLSVSPRYGASTKQAQKKRLSLRHDFYCTKCFFYSFHKIHLESSILNKIKIEIFKRQRVDVFIISEASLKT